MRGRDLDENVIFEVRSHRIRLLVWESEVLRGYLMDAMLDWSFGRNEGMCESLRWFVGILVCLLFLLGNRVGKRLINQHHQNHPLS